MLAANKGNKASPIGAYPAARCGGRNGGIQQRRSDRRHECRCDRQRRRRPTSRKQAAVSGSQLDHRPGGDLPIAKLGGGGSEWRNAARGARHRPKFFARVCTRVPGKRRWHLCLGRRKRRKSFCAFSLRRSEFTIFRLTQMRIIRLSWPAACPRPALRGSPGFSNIDRRHHVAAGISPARHRACPGFGTAMGSRVVGKND